MHEPWRVRAGCDLTSESLRKTGARVRFYKMASPMLLPLLRSRSQGDILAVIMLDAQRERSLGEIAQETGTSTCAR